MKDWILQFAEGGSDEEEGVDDWEQLEDAEDDRVSYINGLVQERCNSSALAMELHLSCPNLSICGCYFAEIFKSIFLIEKLRIFIQISLKLVPKSPINNESALVQIMAWHRSGAKPLSEPLLVYHTDAYMRHLASMS